VQIALARLNLTEVGQTEEKWKNVKTLTRLHENHRIGPGSGAEGVMQNKRKEKSVFVCLGKGVTGSSDKVKERGAQGGRTNLNLGGSAKKRD